MGRSASWRESPGTCCDNHFYNIECASEGLAESACTCKMDGVPTGKTVTSNCTYAWSQCGFPKPQGD